MGITLREIVYDIGEGIPWGKKLKAVQTGGPSGGFIPNHLLDMPVDYERLKEVGAIMGSGGMVVMDEDTCVVDIAKYFLQFTNDESCGKCTACREGSEVLLKILDKISNGEGEETDLIILEELGNAIKEASMCGLGQTLPNPVLSTLLHFKDEYEEHIKYKRCPAAACKGIISSPCQHTCPLEQDIPAYSGLIAQGKFDEAIELIYQKNPLPGICGRVCTARCQTKCRSGEGGGDPISIRALKRFVADYERQKGHDFTLKPKQTRPERVAIVGSGPGGLTCAYFLALKGYGVTIFEALPVIGGMLVTGIPEYRLPRDIMEHEIERIKKLGVEIRTNTTIGKDILLSELKEQYNAVFLAVGAHKGQKLNIAGEDSPHVLDGIGFLKQLHLGQKVKIGKRVAVVGGGDAAVDAARVAKRMGSDVKMLYRRTRREMPASPDEIAEVFREGIEVQFLVTPTRVLSENGRLTGLECIRMKLGQVDQSGRRRPTPIKGSEFTVEIDTLITAIGHQTDLTVLAGSNDVKITKNNDIEIDPETLSCGVEGIFAGGDAVGAPAEVVFAMAHGKIAAEMIHKYIQGQPAEREYKVTRPAMEVEAVELTDKEVEELQKPSMPFLSLDERSGNFREVELGFTEEMAIKEAKRCLRCDLEYEQEDTTL
jgi:NADH-quinone oxidoreductase subunit F